MVGVPPVLMLCMALLTMLSSDDGFMHAENAFEDDPWLWCSLVCRYLSIWMICSMISGRVVFRLWLCHFSTSVLY